MKKEQEQTPTKRSCPLTGRVVIVAPERAQRPMTLGLENRPREKTDSRTECPFCPGMEHDTPNEIYAVRDPKSQRDGPGWQVRVVPNKFPAVRTLLDADGIHEPALGVHELVIDTARHIAHPGELTTEEWQRLLVTYRARLRSLTALPEIRAITIFKNVGAEAGASLAHTHSQIIATDFVPPALQRKIMHINTYGWPKLDPELMVSTTAHVTLLCAEAPRMNYELRLQPNDPQADFRICSDTILHETGALLRRAVSMLDRVLNKPAYNWWLCTLPPEMTCPHFRWHFEIAPRTARIAGFEWATGCFITSICPEDAATKLRGISEANA